jgi:hypothetical protein
VKEREGRLLKGQSQAAENKIYWGEAGWILEDNAAMNNALEKMTFSPYKKYRIYEKQI